MLKNDCCESTLNPRANLYASRYKPHSSFGCSSDACRNAEIYQAQCYDMYGGVEKPAFAEKLAEYLSSKLDAPAQRGQISYTNWRYK